MAAGSDAPVAPPPAVPPPPSHCGSRPRHGCSPAGPWNRAGPPQPPRPPSAAPAGDPYGERVELALREAAPEPSPEAGPGCEELTLDHLLEIVAQLEYHTRPEDGVRICPHFLLGCCFSGARCPPHRTLLPYLWQLWRSTSLPPAFRAPALLLPELRKQSHMSRQTSPEQRLRNERHLFHGTSAGAVPAFCKHNLDPRLPGEHAALYGQGSYFARRASYSHRYAPPAEAGLRHGSLCKVLVGRSGLGQPAPAPGRRRPGQRPVRLVRGQPERPPDLRGLRRRPVLPLLPAPVPPAGGGGEGGL
ncbi:unnamed protein product, partial [Caretta caretta]